MSIDGDHIDDPQNYTYWVQEAKSIVDSMADGIALFNTEPIADKSQQGKTRSDDESDNEVEWSNCKMLQEGNEVVALVPIRHKSRIAEILLTTNGRNDKSINKVVSKLIIRENKDGGKPLIVVGTYICDRSYFENYEGEFANLSYNFEKTRFTGYFIATRMDGSMICGTRIQKGETVFRFVRNPSLSSMRKLDSGDGFHLFLNIQESKSLRIPRSRRASGTLAPEDGGYITCSFCHKSETECTCFVIYPKCDTCGKNLNECICSTSETCDICHQEKKNGSCGCCPVCHTYPCICGKNPRDDLETGQGEGNKPGGGGSTSTGGGSSSGGGGGSVAQPTKVTAERITAAAPLAVQRATKRVGSTSCSACNYGVQEMFKELFGFLPSGMNCMANEMTMYWRNTPEHWRKIQLSEAQSLANQGYFVVAGYIAPGNNSGHVVVVVPGEGGKSPSWGGQVPNTMDTGANKRESKTLFSYSYGSGKKGKVEFYYYYK